MSARRDCYPCRLLATAASFTLFGIGGIALGYIVFPLVSLFSSSKDIEVRRCRKLIQRCFRGFVWFLTTFGVFTVEISGREKLARPGQLIVANHPTLLDIVFLISMIDNATCIVKLDVARNFFMRGPVARAGYVPNDSPETLIDNCVEQLGNGATLVIFPEGTRSQRGKSMRFRRGASYVQLKSNCNVLLAVISSTPPTLSKHEKWYQIPLSRPHYKLVFTEDSMSNAEEVSAEPAATPRSLTRQWQDYFANEVAT